MKPRVGLYHFTRNWNNTPNTWTIWKYVKVQRYTASSNFVKEVDTYEEAVREVCSLNGWREPRFTHKRT
jgi:hypothetical protein